MIDSFQPVTKADVARILRISLRTVDYWVETGEMPAPRTIGRRVYWHPDDFYAWLGGRLRHGQPATAGVAATQPAAVPADAPKPLVVRDSAMTTGKPVRRRSAAPACVGRSSAVKRAQARVAKLNAP